MLVIKKRKEKEKKRKERKKTFFSPATKIAHEEKRILALSLKHS